MDGKRLHEWKRSKTGLDGPFQTIIINFGDRFDQVLRDGDQDEITPMVMLVGLGFDLGFALGFI